MKTIWFFRNSKKVALKIIIAIYVLSFLVATYNHVMPFIAGGLHVYQLQNENVPGWLNYYWSSLGILDPLAIVILLLNIKAGIILYLLIIYSDVLINFWFAITNYGFGEIVNIFQLCQLGFLLFLTVTCMLIATEIRKLHAATA
jgi:hypothetical protein